MIKAAVNLARAYFNVVAAGNTAVMEGKGIPLNDTKPWKPSIEGIKIEHRRQKDGPRKKLQQDQSN